MEVSGSTIFIYKFYKFKLYYLLGPLINIKKAIFRIKEEISEMDVKIGVMKHLLENEMIKQSAQYNEFDSLVMMAH